LIVDNLINVKGLILLNNRLLMNTKLIIYTNSFSKSDVHTFKATAIQLKNDYRKYNNHIELFFTKSGKDIVQVIKNKKLTQ